MSEHWWKDMVEVPNWAEGLMIYIGVLQARVSQLEKEFAFNKESYGNSIINLAQRMNILEDELLRQREVIHGLQEKLVLLRGPAYSGWDEFTYESA